MTIHKWLEDPADITAWNQFLRSPTGVRFYSVLVNSAPFRTPTLASLQDPRASITPEQCAIQVGLHAGWQGVLDLLCTMTEYPKRDATVESDYNAEEIHKRL